jgi:hypothetical protein
VTGRHHASSGVLLQTSGLGGLGSKTLFYSPTSSSLEINSLTDESNGLRDRTGTDAETAFDDASFTTDVLREVEDRRLALA